MKFTLILFLFSLSCNRQQKRQLILPGTDTSLREHTLWDIPEQPELYFLSERHFLYHQRPEPFELNPFLLQCRVISIDHYQEAGLADTIIEYSGK